jgi:hypothetical protein
MADNFKTTQGKHEPNLTIYQRELRCPVHKCLLGRYDSRFGAVNLELFCPKCGKKYTFTRQKEESCQKGVDN